MTINYSYLTLCIVRHYIPIPTSISYSFEWPTQNKNISCTCKVRSVLFKFIQHRCTKHILNYIVSCFALNEYIIIKSFVYPLNSLILYNTSNMFLNFNRWC